MKQRILFTIVFCFLILPKVFCDSPNCIKYELELTLQNDSIVTGFFFFHGLYMHIDGKPLDSISFNDYYLDKLKSPSKKETIFLYKNVRKISLNENENFNLYFCANNEKVKVLIKDIKSFRELGISSCFPEIDKEIKYTGHGCWPVVSELTETEIKKLESKKPFLSFDYSNMYFDDGLSYLMVFSFNETFNEQELKDLIFQKCCSNLPNNFKWTELEKNYSLLKKELVQKGIIIFKVNYYN